MTHTQNFLKNSTFEGLASNKSAQKSKNICEGWTISHKSAPDKYEFSYSKKTYAGINFLEIDLKSATSWFRVLNQLSTEMYAYNRFYFRMELAGLEGEEDDLISRITIMEYDQSNTGTVFTKFISKAKPKPFIDYIDCVFTVTKPFDPEKKYFFCIQLMSSLKLSIGQPVLLPLDKFGLRPSIADIISESQTIKADAPPPYLTYSNNNFDLLKKLNADMSPTCKSNRTGWQLDMLALTLKMEMYDTAEGLANYLALQPEHLSEAQEILRLKLTTDVYIALGKSDEIYNLFLKHSELFLKNDSLSVAITFLMYKKYDISPADHKLPSGGHNTFVLNNEILDSAPKRKLEHLIEASKISRNHEGKQLILANCHVSTDITHYKSLFNDYLKSYKLPQIEEISFADDNILKTIKFEVTQKVQSNTKISVIIAGYNCAQTIGYALRSILDQSYTNIEVLFCDDNSTDNTIEEAFKHAHDTRLRIFKSTENQGPYQIRNKLMALATGDIITIHDSDDFALPTRIETQAEQMLTEDALISLARWIRITPEGSFVTFRDHQSLRMCVNSIMFYREVFERVGAFRATLCGGDTEFYEKARSIFGAERTLQVIKPMVLGLWSDSSLTKQGGIEASDDGYRAPKRRAYAEIASRQRLLGCDIISDNQVLDILKQNNIYRDASALIPVS